MIRPLETFLAKGHRPFCAIKNWTGPRRCTCGLEAAQAEFKQMRQTIIRLSNRSKGEQNARQKKANQPTQN